LDEETDRWPLFVPAARNAGFRSVAAMPLRLRDQTIGGLNLFMDSPQAVPEADRELAQALADVATIGILQQRSLHRSHVLSEPPRQSVLRPAARVVNRVKRSSSRTQRLTLGLLVLFLFGLACLAATLVFTAHDHLLESQHAPQSGAEQVASDIRRGHRLRALH